MAIVGRFFGARPRPARLDQVILICIPAVITSVVLYGLYYHLQGAWQLLAVAGGGFLSLTGFGLSLLLSLLVVLGVVPLFVEGLTPYIVGSASLLIVVVGAGILPGRWRTWLAVAAIFGVYAWLVDRLAPLARYAPDPKVANTAAAPPFNLSTLQGAFAHKADKSGVFESSQDPIIVGQGAYNSAYGTSFQSNGSLAGLVQIYDENLAFKTLLGQTLTMPLERKAIQDEMGEAFEKEYGRMSGNLGLEAPNAQPGQQQNLILYPYVNPASEVIKGVELAGLSVTPISATNDGTQIWKITHNGVDTHPIHFHLFDVQLLNRVGWDGIIRKPDANELGWKDTVRISPLEDTIVALRPIIPKIPFGVPDSLRALNPAMPIGSTDMFNNTDALGNPISPPITNQVVNFGWEYVWHCHILSHEEMDMMRPMSVNVNRVLPAPPLVTTFTVNPTTGYGTSNIVTLTAPPAAPSGLTATAVRSGKKANVTLNWIDNSTDETGFEIQRATNATFTVGLNSSTVAANSVTATQTGLYRGVRYFYRVRAFNTGGPSGWSNVFSVVTP